MRRPCRARRSLAALAAAATSVVALAVASASPATAAPAPTAATAASAAASIPDGRYVAMGDSFSAGSGILPLSLTANPLCAQSSINYPHLLAKRTGRALKDVTCGGSDTADFTTSQYPGTPPQLNAVTADTTLITIGVGGNNSSLFSSLIKNCMSAGLSTLGYGSPCKNKYGSSYTTTVQQQTYPAVRDAIGLVRAKAPRAKIVVAGYPQVLPPTKGCFLAMPIASGDVPYVNGIEMELNAVVKKAARDNGATFVDMWAASAGRDACKSPSVRWVEPAIGSLNFVPIHPNAAGERAYADQIQAQVPGL